MSRKNPDAKRVLENLKDLPRTGILSKSIEGMIYLDLDDEWIFKALEVLKDYDYTRPPFFKYPPTPVGAHIKIVTKREAEDNDIENSQNFSDFTELLGKSFGFKIKKAFVSHPKVDNDGIDTRYVIRVEINSELVKIRKDLTGKITAPNNGFEIIVGITKKKE